MIDYRIGMHSPTATLPLAWPTKREETAVDAQHSWTTGEEYLQHAQCVRRYAYALVRNMPEAEDIMQESFVRLIQTLRSGGDVQRPKPWLLRVAHNLALDALAKRPREVPLDEEDPDQLADPATPSPEAAVATRQQQERLVAALRALSAQELRCWTLRSEGLRYREIAEILGIQTGTVATFLMRAAEKLSSL
jgi:RNA polymerase sigma-70 factor (ECF subfamily)